MDTRPAVPGLHPRTPDDPPGSPPGRTNDLIVSRTDPDAALVGREGVPVALYHKLHVGVDGGTARIITALDVTPGDIADEALLDRIRKEHERTTGWTVNEVTADAKLGHTRSTRCWRRAAAAPASHPIGPLISSVQSRASSLSTIRLRIASPVPRGIH